MAKQKFEVVSEVVYRANHEIELDLEELRKNNEDYATYTDEEIIIAEFDKVGFNFSEYTLEETNVRTIFDESGESIYED